jgi:beta-galactosidase
MLYSALRPQLGKRRIYLLRDDWHFAKVQPVPEGALPIGPFSTIAKEREYAWESVRLPHAPDNLPAMGIPEDSARGVYFYEKSFELTLASDERAFLVFEGAMTVADVELNGTFLGRHSGGYTAFNYDITDALAPSPAQQLMVRLDSRIQSGVPPEGGLMDYRIFGGIYRKVYLVVTSATHVRDLVLTTLSVEDDEVHVRAELTLTAPVLLTNSKNENSALAASSSLKYRLELDVCDEGGRVVHTETHELEDGLREGQYSWGFVVQGVKQWSVSNPTVYRITFRLVDDRGALWDDGVIAFGFRTISICNGKIAVNGKAISLVGLNRHQSFPFLGYAAPERLQRRDAEVLKYELGLNYVRTSHYPQDPAFLDACDELGLLVFMEIPGWQHVGDEDWQNVSLTHVQEMIERHRHHPSVFMWGVRINESFDHDDFYAKTNALARALDASRPTGGVRNFRNSTFLEDVFTFNDFSMQLLPNVHTPQMVTEFLGHMYPTKMTDNENRLIQHARYHAQILSQLGEREDLAGASGWCAFDYPTMSFFGGGNQICHHGVMDQFRLPKFAAAVYRSQKSPQDEIVLEPGTYLTFEAANHPQLLQELESLDHMESVIKSDGYAAPIYVFSNCDSLEVVFNGRSRGRIHPDRRNFPGLAHPPFVVHLQAYKLFGTLEIRGYLGEKMVIEKTIQSPRPICQLRVHADHTSLDADGVDMSRIWVEAVDANGTRGPYANRVIHWTLETVNKESEVWNVEKQAQPSDARLIGENPIALEAGRAALYLRAGTKPERLRITVQSPGLADDFVEVDVVKAREVPKL